MTSIGSGSSPARWLFGGVVPLFLLAGMLCGSGGCQSQQQKEPEAAPVTATPDKIAAIRASIEKAQPGSLVGRVINTLGDRPYAAVADIPVQDVAIGETITFV